jgi:hypothetical protein
MIKAFLLFILLSSDLFAAPQKIEMVFLSPDKKVSLIQLIDQMQNLQKYKKISENEMENCVPMGDGCFHPQLGFIQKSDMEKTENNKPKIVPDEEVKLKTFNAVETSLVNCDKSNYFDIYCGQSTAIKNYDTEVWFDVSSSLRQVDYNKDPNFCKRRSFLEAVSAKCKGKVDFSIYNTSLKQLGDFASVCLSYGTNDEKRLLSWIKSSQTRRLMIVTDVDEMSEEMKSYLDISGAKIMGDGVKAFTADDLVKYANEFIKGCN